MIGLYPVIVFLLLVTLTNGGYLLAHKHGSPGWVGVLIGFGAWVAVLSGHLISLMVRDWFERTKCPKHQDVGPWVKPGVVSVFVASFLLTAWLCLLIFRH
jgi:hypothetical protein